MPGPLMRSASEISNAPRALGLKGMLLTGALILFGMALLLESAWINERLARRLIDIEAAPVFAHGRMTNASLAWEREGRTQLAWRFMANGRLQSGAMVYAGAASVIGMGHALPDEGVELVYLAHDPDVNAPRPVYERRAQIAKAAKSGWRATLYVCGFMLVSGLFYLLFIRE